MNRTSFIIKTLFIFVLTVVLLFVLLIVQDASGVLQDINQVDFSINKGSFNYSMVPLMLTTILAFGYYSRMAWVRFKTLSSKATFPLFIALFLLPQIILRFTDMGLIWFTGWFLFLSVYPANKSVHNTKDTYGIN